MLEDKKEVKAPEGEDLIKKRAKSEERPTIGCGEISFRRKRETFSELNERKGGQTEF